ncbi:capsular polysaccharide biosynthesis protein [Aureimonas sp. SA4125]|uniref:polysaccharide biosynthesis protein n=1 Tax=Aureimonas sp. SA4125 TaxID=2826993 RepID=UPI001CC79544|nr:nucleoside-diphosphate sugar epimerase/dehydratase [Aureimonas sp. SA4125]BDA82959.1 capsular polysaccharide biosynthesis protein [Aureimonas sp. SA4125]
MTIRLDEPPRTRPSLGLQAVLLYAAVAVGRLLAGPSSRPWPKHLDRDKLYVAVSRRLRGRFTAVLNQRFLYAGDLGMAALAVLVAVLIRLGIDSDTSDTESVHAVFVAAPWFLVTCAVTFPFTRLYVRNWKYASVADLLGIARAVFVAALVFVVWMFATRQADAFPRSVMVIAVLLLVPLLTTVRLAMSSPELYRFGRWSRAQAEGLGDRVPVLLIGAGDEADLYLRAVQRDATAPHSPVGILERSPVSEGYCLRGVPILGTMSELESVIADLETRALRPRHLILTDKAGGFNDPVMETLINQAERLGIAISRPAPVLELRDPKAAGRFDLRPIELTDLLERPQTALDKAVLRRMVENRRIVVTGAGGSIGGELALQLAALSPSKIVLIESSEFNLYAIDLELSEKHPNVPRAPYLCDVRDAGRLAEIFDRHQPELVFHAAALKHVPMVELNPCEGILTNVVGTMNVAEATRRCGAQAMVQISTDKVVNATSVMGATKRLGELYCQALDLAGGTEERRTRFMTVRFGNVLGSSGSLVPLFKRQLARGGPLTVTDTEMKRFFMTLREAVELTLQASTSGLEKQFGRGEIFVLDMGEPIKIIDMARRMIKLAGYRPDTDIKIEIVGCRPGEKLFEELFDPSEQRMGSPVPGVLRAVPAPVPLGVLRGAFAQLAHLARAGDADGVMALLADVLPSYRRRDGEGSASVVPLEAAAA